MKAKIFLLVLFIFSYACHAQLIINERGQTVIGMDTIYNNTHTKLSIGKVVQGYGTSILSQDIGVLYLCNDTASYSPTYGINADLHFKAGNPIGVDVKSTGHGSQIVTGVRSIVNGGNNYERYGCGIFGGLSFKSHMNGGVGIYGGTSSLLNIPNGYYAGYFNGDVRVTGSLYGTVLSPTSTSSEIGQSPELIATEISTEDEYSITNRLQQVSLLKMHRVNNDGSLAANKKIEQRKITDSDATGLDDFSKEDTSYDEKEEQGKQTQLSEISYGLAADQLKEVFPELVYEDKEGNFSINYVEMVPLLVQSIRELSAEVTELRQQLGLEKTVKKSKQQVTAIEKEDNTKSDKNSTTYDLSGRPIANPQRGIYVKDGKKITVQ